MLILQTYALKLHFAVVSSEIFFCAPRISRRTNTATCCSPPVSTRTEDWLRLDLNNTVQHLKSVKCKGWPCGIFHSDRNQQIRGSITDDLQQNLNVQRIIRGSFEGCRSAGGQLHTNDTHAYVDE